MKELTIQGISGPVAMKEVVKVDMNKVIDCARCAMRGNRSQPISPIVGYCRACGYPYHVSEDGQWGWDGRNWRATGTFIK